MPFWRGRDRERFIGGYDPEHEMPDPDRMRMGRYESDAYRHNAEDSRWGYRWNPDRIEDRWQERGRNSMPAGWNRDPRDRAYHGAAAPRDYERGAQWDRGWDRDQYRDRSDYGMADYGRNPQGGYGRNFGNSDRGGYDRGFDRPHDRGAVGRADYGRNDYPRPDYGRSDYGRDSFDERDRWERNRDFGGGRSTADWDREARSQHDRDYGWDDVGDISYDRNRGRRY